MHSQTRKYFWNNDIIHLGKEQSNYQTKILGTQNGLPNSEITCLTQDSNGFLWVGTSAGFASFDGKRFKNYLKAGYHFTGKIYTIREDTVRKVLWIACDAGLCYLKNEELSIVRTNEGDVTTYDIYPDESNNMWVATAKGPAFFTSNIINNLISDSIITLATYLLPEWKNFEKISDQVYKIVINQTGDLYFSGERSLFTYANKNLKTLWTSSEQENNDGVVGLVPGKKDSVYFATIFGGFGWIVKNKITWLNENNCIAVALTENKGQLYYFASGGIYKFHPSSKQLEKISEVPESINLWPSCLLVDNENNFWIGMHDNLLYQKPRIFYSYKNETDNISPEIFSIFRLKNNQLIFGTNRGKIYRRNGAVLKNYFPGNGRVVTRAEIKAIYEDSRGWLWMGSGYQGISILKNKQVLNFTVDKGLSNNSNYFIYEDANQNIYTGGDGGFSKISYDPVNDKFLFKNYFFKVSGDNTYMFKSCIAGPDGSLWLMGQKGIFHFINDELKPYLLNGNNIPNGTDIKSDKSGNIWIATKGDGIWQCFFDDKHLLQIRRIISDKNGLQSNIYLSLVIDNQSTVWAAGYGGISSIKQNGKNIYINNYTPDDGFLSSNYQSVTLFHDENDTIWVATSSGLSTFYAGNAAINKTLSLSIDNILLLDTADKDISILKKKLYSGIELPYYVNAIEFQFKAICLSDARNIRYSYRMMGLKDTTWLDWVDKEVAVYQSLPPGKYSFQVKALLNNNVPSNTVTFFFTINSPFWFSWWFILISICFFITIIFLVLKKWEKTVQFKNDEKIKTQKLISEHLQYRLEVEEVTNYFNRLMSVTETEDELLWDVARQCISKLNFEDCVIYLRNKRTNHLVQKAAWGPKVIMAENEMFPENAILSPIEIPVGSGIVGTVAKTGVAEIVPDVTKDPRYILDDAQRCSEIAVPIIYENQVLGVIDSESSHFNYYTQWHLQILSDIAVRCAERIVKLRTNKSLEKNKIKLLQTRQKLAEERLTALRSQMSPHFIFNSLNSIQQFVLGGDVESANKYLSQFSKLIRLVLQYSETNFITLDEEISMLHLYLSLEKTRFGDTFEYNIYLEENIDADEIKIPNLMVQPFVENAIWHGLMHKKGSREIKIHFRLSEDKTLVCEIVDNGIGRRRSEEIKKTRSVDIKHQSKGLKLVQDRSEALMQQFGKEILIEINDLINDVNEVSGTRVLIMLPLTGQIK
ncbi:MAG: two-component regulator propeller domain-containing protein [Ginsengibacter sp.]